MARRWLVALLLFSATLLSASAADDPKPKARPTAEALRDWGVAQERIARQYRECQNRMLLLAQRLENGGADERRAAIPFRKALEVAEREGVSNRFARLIHFASREARLTNLVGVLNDSETQVKALGTMLDVLASENRAPELRKELEGRLGRLREEAGQARLVGRVKADGEDAERFAGELRRLSDALRAAVGKAAAAELVRRLQAIRQAQSEQSAALKRIILDFEWELSKDLSDDPKQP